MTFKKSWKDRNQQLILILLSHLCCKDEIQKHSGTANMLLVFEALQEFLKQYNSHLGYKTTQFVSPTKVQGN